MKTSGTIKEVSGEVLSFFGKFVSSLFSCGLVSEEQRPKDFIFVLYFSFFLWKEW